MAKSRKERRIIKRQEAILRKLEKKKANSLGDLIDMSQGMFEKYIDNKHLNLGQLKLLKQNFTFIYWDVKAKNDALIAKVSDAKNERDKENRVKLINRMFFLMQRIENRCVFLTNRIDALNEEFNKGLKAN